MFSLGLCSQELHHQMMSSQGKSIALPNGMYVSQTIGQQSVIGNSSKAGYSYGQGFQQSAWGKRVTANVNNSITTVTYPNPFVETVNFEFSKPIASAISVNVFDIQGRLVFQQEKNSVGNILSINMTQLAESNYLVQLTAPNFTYYTQILKKS